MTPHAMWVPIPVSLASEYTLKWVALYPEIDLFFSKVAFPYQNSTSLLTPGNCFNELGLPGIFAIYSRVQSTRPELDNVFYDKFY